MSRSKNSRRGTYRRCKDPSCSVCHRSNYKQIDTKKWKRNFLQFDGVFFKYGRKNRQKKQGYSGNWLNEYHIKEIKRSKKSYREWSWLKGKPNEKSKHHNKYKCRFWGSGSLR